MGLTAFNRARKENDESSSTASPEVVSSGDASGNDSTIQPHEGDVSESGSDASAAPEVGDTPQPTQAKRKSGNHPSSN
jgi:hypothetical protein